MDLNKLNSLTKYPSILTYHSLGDRGRLTEALSESRGFPEAEDVYVYEKVDGENSRILLLRGEEGIDYLIGSREELLYAKGDRIGNPYGNIAAFLRPLAEELCAALLSVSLPAGDWALTVIYQESYGGKTKAAKNYTANQTQGSRVFDVFSLNAGELESLLSLPQEKIAAWREHDQQPFYSEERRMDFVHTLHLAYAPLLARVRGADVPRTLEGTFSFLKPFGQTQVGLDTAGRSEGVIARTADRKLIRKIRFEDYERTFRAQG
ncbi:RNA ligase family protein [Paenibacillus caseinilyticus]|uniref:RNA ligase domain-containing protein n=1 Tax=Paenibacillus mucilaginosus K02 TaxID=997761 RepID=I0BMY8_9BACL|nr:RNA ligase family protein [Paenibacillus mucilaginosus]AFH63735.1 hypothetical protein B2K_24120 [Paenibacillus mucilaginosus K02]